MDTNRNLKPPLPDGPKPAQGGSTVAQLKDDIDKGRTGDRASTGDPGLSMLGTDDEAGGTPNSPELIDQMRKLETGRSNAGTDPSQAPAVHDQNQKSFPLALVLTAAVIAALIVVAIILLQA
jgi:hypothetical protein